MRYDRYKTTEETKDISKDVKKFIDFYGSENQEKKAIEELNELIEAIKEKDKIHIAEEIADVEIMLKQLKIIYDIQQGVIEEIKLYKIDRQNQRMLGQNEKKTLTRSKNSGIIIASMRPYT